MKSEKGIRSKLLWISIFIVMIFFMISLSGILYPPWDEMARRIANRGYNGEGLIEHIEAINWLISFLFLSLIVFKIRNLNLRFTKWWILFFAVMSFLAMGEEVSWGDHMFDFESEMAMEYNYQNETNIHNLNINEIFGIQEESVFYPYLLNFGYLLNPMFYLSFFCFWSLIPYWKKTKSGKKYRWLTYYPNVSGYVALFCGITILFFLIFDRIFFDVGELIELSISFTALLFSTDLYFKYKREPKSIQSKY